MDSLEINKILAEFSTKRILVTGDTGFKGSWLAFWLHQLGADVVGYALPPKRSHDHFSGLQLNTSIHHIDGDVRDFSTLAKISADFQPELIFHLAAQSLVRESYQSPKETFEVNVGGSVNLLEIARTIPSVRAMIYVTSDKCYKNKEWMWGYRENDELGGHDPYSASKAAAEIVYQAYQHSFFDRQSQVGVASVRAGNVIGGGDWSDDRIVPDTISAFMQNKPIHIRHPEATRPWQHVLDPLFGYMLLAIRLYHAPTVYSGAWNFGPHSRSIQPVRALVTKMIEVWGGGEMILAEHPPTLHEATKLHLNCDKAQQLLQWQPCWDFEKSVVQTVDWYKQVAEGVAVRQLTQQQINTFIHQELR